MWIACWTWGARRPMKVLTTSLHQSIQKTVFMVDLSQLLLEWQQLCRRKTLVMKPFLRFVDLFAVMFMYMNIHKIALCLNFHCINIQVIYIIKTFFIKLKYILHWPNYVIIVFAGLRKPVIVSREKHTVFPWTSKQQEKIQPKGEVQHCLQKATVWTQVLNSKTGKHNNMFSIYMYFKSTIIYSGQNVFFLRHEHVYAHIDVLNKLFIV